MKVAFTPGKGNKLVPILFPNDIIDGLKIISDKTEEQQLEFWTQISMCSLSF